MKRLHELCHPHDPPSPPSPRRGFARQRAARQRESLLRSHIVELTRWTSELGFSLPETAHLLHLAPRTLREWRSDCRTDLPRIHGLGRPILRSSFEERTAVLEVLHELGPATSVATLRASFPRLPRAELADLLKRYRRVWHKRYEPALACLSWQVPGAVWAMDFSEAPRPIDGIYPYLLAVRDLASHQQLLWLPVFDMTQVTVIDALWRLFVTHGAPLVMKTDNGSAFRADATEDFLLSLGVHLLFSPPGTPWYNGAIEAGIGSLKTRTDRHADRAGHPGYWTSDDVAAAQLEANATARPHGETGPTPDEIWQARSSTSPEERRRFQATIAHCDESNPEGACSRTEERRIQRQAIRRALVEHGILLFSRRRIPQLITPEKTANFM